MRSSRAYVAALAMATMFWQGAIAADDKAGSTSSDRWPILLLAPDVQKELSLSDGQLEKVGKIVGGPSDPKEKREEVERRVTEFLKPEQRVRLTEIRNQILLTRGAMSAELMQSLKLTDDQTSQLNQVLSENNKQNAILLKRLQTENLRVPGAREKLKKKYYDVARERVMGVLATEQRAALKEKLGNEFPGSFELAESL